MPLTHGPVLGVGDAAAATDPMTGEGIGQAIETGRLAVKCIADARPATRPATRPEVATLGTDGAAPAVDGPALAYERALRKGMVKDHRLARLLSRVLSTEWGSQWSVNIAGVTPWTRRNFARWLFEDYPRAVLGTPGRWHRRLFTNDGAYASVE